MERASVDGIELEYEVKGTGDPVLLIHGAHIAGGFLPLLSQPSLADRCQLIRYHRRGFAGSTHAAPPVSIEEQARDAAGILAHLGIARAHVAGHSYGGAIALQLALDRPEAVHSLVLLEPALMTVPSGEAFFEQVGPAVDAYAAGDNAEAVASFLAVVSGLDRETGSEVVEAAAPGSGAQAVKDADTFFALELPALGDWTFGPDQARSIRQPVLSVVGADSTAVFVEGRDLLHSWFPQTEDLDVEGAGHLLQMQQPERVAKGLADFITRHPLSGDAPGGRATALAPAD